jgi:ABC-type transport system involved in multi-copper enzyme maturation permease subunit
MLAIYIITFVFISSNLPTNPGDYFYKLMFRSIHLLFSSYTSGSFLIMAVLFSCQLLIVVSYFICLFFVVCEFF